MGWVQGMDAKHSWVECRVPPPLLLVSDEHTARGAFKEHTRQGMTSKHAAAHTQQQRCKGSRRQSTRHAALLGRQHAAWSVLTSGARCRRSRPRAVARPTAPKSLPAPPPRPAWHQSTCRGNMAELWQRWAGTVGEPVAPLPATPVAQRHEARG